MIDSVLAAAVRSTTGRVAKIGSPFRLVLWRKVTAASSWEPCPVWNVTLPVKFSKPEKS